MHNSSILFRKSHHDSRRNQVLEHEVKRLRNAIVLGGKDDIGIELCAAVAREEPNELVGACRAGAIEVLEETVKEKQEMLELANRQVGTSFVSTHIHITGIYSQQALTSCLLTSQLK